jgi:hypothetical protein
VGDRDGTELHAINDQGIHQWKDSAFRRVAELPQGVRAPAHTMNAADVFAFDPSERSILVLTDADLFEIALR